MLALEAKYVNEENQEMLVLIIKSNAINNVTSTERYTVQALRCWLTSSFQLSNRKGLVCKNYHCAQRHEKKYILWETGRATGKVVISLRHDGSAV
jgi:hypothetical protein